MIILEIIAYIVGFAIGSSLFFYFSDKIEEKKKKRRRETGKGNIYVQLQKKFAAKGERG